MITLNILLTAFRQQVKSKRITDDVRNSIQFNKYRGGSVIFNFTCYLKAVNNIFKVIIKIDYQSFFLIPNTSNSVQGLSYYSLFSIMFRLDRNSYSLVVYIFHLTFCGLPSSYNYKHISIYTIYTVIHHQWSLITTKMLHFSKNITYHAVR